MAVERASAPGVASDIADWLIGHCSSFFGGSRFAICNFKKTENTMSNPELDFYRIERPRLIAAGIVDYNQ